MFLTVAGLIHLVTNYNNKPLKSNHLWPKQKTAVLFKNKKQQKYTEMHQMMNFNLKSQFMSHIWKHSIRVCWVHLLKITTKGSLNQVKCNSVNKFPIYQCNKLIFSNYENRIIKINFLGPRLDNLRNLNLTMLIH